MKKDSAASKLRVQVSARLEQFTREGDKLSRELVQLSSQRLDKTIKLGDLMQQLEL